MVFWYGNLRALDAGPIPASSTHSLTHDYTANVLIGAPFVRGSSRHDTLRTVVAPGSAPFGPVRVAQGCSGEW